LIDPSEAQPQTIARKGTRFSVNNEPAVLSASLWRPLRVRVAAACRASALHAAKQTADAVWLEVEYYKETSEH
jgi:hypothetical protein